MALYKEIKDEKGIISKYFRISDVLLDTDNKNISIGVKEYADNTYRNKEKNKDILQVSINNLQKEIDILNENYRDNEDEVIKKQSEISDLVSQLNDLNSKDYYIGEKKFSFNFEDKEYSLSICYDLLKTLDTFIDSKDI